MLAAEEFSPEQMGVKLLTQSQIDSVALVHFTGLPMIPFLATAKFLYTLEKRHPLIKDTVSSHMQRDHREVRDAAPQRRHPHPQCLLYLL